MLVLKNYVSDASRFSCSIFWQKVSFLFHPNENKISKTLIKLHEHESDQIYRSIIRSAFNTHTSQWDWCGKKANNINDFNACFGQNPAIYVCLRCFFYNIKFDISTIWDHYFYFFHKGDSHRDIWVYVVHDINICLMYHILLRACFMKSEKKMFKGEHD